MESDIRTELLSTIILLCFSEQKRDNELMQVMNFCHLRDSKQNTSAANSIVILAATLTIYTNGINNPIRLILSIHCPASQK